MTSRYDIWKTAAPEDGEHYENCPCYGDDDVDERECICEQEDDSRLPGAPSEYFD